MVGARECGYYRLLRVSGVAKELLASEEEICSVEYFSACQFLYCK